MASKDEEHRSKVFLIGFDEDGAKVEEVTIGYDDYYNQSSPLIDDGAYRSLRRVVKVVGTIYNSAGEIQSEFDNSYGKHGEYVRSRTVHRDGTVTEDP
jgi:hypothetical protein